MDKNTQVVPAPKKQLPLFEVQCSSCGDSHPVEDMVFAGDEFQPVWLCPDCFQGEDVSAWGNQEFSNE